MDLLARLKLIYWALPSRCARPASLARNLAKTFAQSLGMWTAFLLLGPLVLWHFESWLLPRGWPLPRFEPLPIFAATTFGFGWLLAWSSAWVLVRWGEGTPLPIDATNKLVVRGPYHIVRNPMAIGSLLQGAAIGLWFGSPLILIYALAGGMIWNFAVRPWEEADMRARFGTDCARYQRQVRCWWPRFSGYQG